MIRRLDHVAISVADLDRSLAFYTGNFGCIEQRRIPPRNDSSLASITGLVGARATIVHLTLGESLIELFHYDHPRGSPLSAERRQADHGLTHLGLASTDVRADHARLVAKGMRFFGPPVEFRPGVWVVYGWGPDREVIELREVP